jgi:hypothetical protein
MALRPLLAWGDPELIGGPPITRGDADGFDHDPLWTEPLSILAGAVRPLLVKAQVMLKISLRFHAAHDDAMRWSGDQAASSGAETNSFATRAFPRLDQRRSDRCAGMAYILVE